MSPSPPVGRTKLPLTSEPALSASDEGAPSAGGRDLKSKQEKRNFPMMPQDSRTSTSGDAQTRPGGGDCVLPHEWKEFCEVREVMVQRTAHFETAQDMERSCAFYGRLEWLALRSIIAERREGERLPANLKRKRRLSSSSDMSQRTEPALSHDDAANVSESICGSNYSPSDTEGSSGPDSDLDSLRSSGTVRQRGGLSMRKRARRMTSAAKNPGMKVTEKKDGRTMVSSSKDDAKPEASQGPARVSSLQNRAVAIAAEDQSGGVDGVVAAAQTPATPSNKPAPKLLQKSVKSKAVRPNVKG
ncbi:hypothetical protein C8Q79DRAFT_927612 [Trametes meyenii]|nr:hypothetical protein C8Q79DRAFT_927612 [Trametes meyenii]